MRECFLFVCFTEEENAFPQRALDSSIHLMDVTWSACLIQRYILIVPKWFFLLISFKTFLSALKNHCHAHPSLFFLCSLWWMPKIYTTYRGTICVLCNLDGTLPIFPFLFFPWATSVCVFFTSFNMYDIFFPFLYALKKTLPLFHYIFFSPCFFLFTQYMTSWVILIESKPTNKKKSRLFHFCLKVLQDFSLLKPDRKVSVVGKAIIWQY